jgi:two-component SAPR family response regulator
VKVLFIDVELGGAVNGIDLAQQVHRARPEIELVVTSASGSLSDRLLPDDGTLLREPFRVEDLVRVLRQKLC